MQAIIFCGIQASGKSSFYKELFFHSHVRISLDLLRTRHREQLFLTSCLKTQMRFVVDNTNPTVQERQKYIELAKSAHYEIIGYYFETDVAVALTRNKEREGRHLVPERGIFGTRKKLQPPTFAEGFDQLYVVRPGQNNSFVVRQLLQE